MAISNFVLWIMLVTISSVASEDISLNHACRTPIYEGTCIIVHNCTFAIRLLAKNEQKALKSMFCGFENKLPKVCCPLEESLNTIAYKNTEETATSRPKPEVTTRALLTTTKQPDEPHVLPDRSVCGAHNPEERIYGGTVASIDEFPWIARIKFLNHANKEIYACAGSLITDRYVITAAHCITTLKVVSVRLGEWSTQSDVDCYENQCNNKPVDVDVDKVLPFPGYNKKNYTRGDIALLRLAQPVNFTDFIQPICLPTTDYTAMKDYEFDSAYLTAGWGMTELEKESVVKRKVYLDAVPMDVCRAALPIIPESSVPYVICAGGRKGKDSCRGDSGGPLVKLVEENYKMNWFLYGITSLGPKTCGTEGFPGMYTRVTAYMSWIRRTIQT